MASRTKKQTSTADNGRVRKTLAEYSYGTATIIDVPLAMLVVEFDTFARGITAKHLARMIKEHDPRLLDLPVVTPIEDGYFSVLDGWHRHEMCRALGIDPVTCRLVPNEGLEDRARMFRDLNKRKLWLHPTGTFKTDLTIGESWAIEADRCLTDRGLAIKSKLTPDGIASVRSLEDVYTRGGSVRLCRTCDAILGGWPDNQPRRFSGLIIKAVALYIEDNPKTDDARLVRALASTTPSLLTVNANQRWFGWQLGDDRGGSKVEAASAEIKKLYAKARA